MAARDFKSCFCRKFRCPPEDYVQKVFWRCLYRRAVPFAKLIMWHNPEFFSHDLTLIEEAGSAMDVESVMAAIVEFYRYTGYRKSYWHNQLRCRVSGRRLLDLAQRCWDAAANYATGS